MNSLFEERESKLAKQGDLLKPRNHHVDFSVWRQSSANIAEAAPLLWRATTVPDRVDDPPAGYPATA